MNTDRILNPIKYAVDVERVVRVKRCELTQEEWRLFDIDGYDVAAQQLNAQFMWSVNQGLTRPEVEQHMDFVMQRHAAFGATDTEPQAVLVRLLDHVFGRED